MLYCKKCGKEMVEGSIFCPNCGTEVKEVNKSEKKQLLYESGSGNKAIMTIEVILGLILCAIAIFIIVVSTSTDMQRNILGGIHREPMTLTLLGVGVLCFGIAAISIGVNNISCWTKIYDSHIEAKTTTLIGLGNNRDVVIYNNQIDSVSRVGKIIAVTASGTKYNLYCEDPDRVYQLIIQKCSRH